MNRKITASILGLLLSAGAALPASAAGRRATAPSSGSSFSACERPALVCEAAQELLCGFSQRFCENLFCPGEVCAPSDPDEPAQPDEPSAPDTPSDGASLAYEQAVAGLVNAQRAQAGLPALHLDGALCLGARAKSQDMQQSHYFSHTSPNYGSPYDMMRQFGISYSYAGENIAMGYQTPETVVEAWMASPSHRENILSENYSALGVGYVSDGGYWTQWFIG